MEYGVSQLTRMPKLLDGASFMGVEKQFGDAIRTTILDVLARYNVRGVQLNVDDKGALDCILRARLEALLARASGIPALPWEDCQ